MDFLARDTVSFSEDFWKQIDTQVVDTVKKNLVGRRFLSLYGPLGAGTTSINIDETTSAEEDKDGVVKTVGRRYVELPQLHEDFVLYWRDIERSEATGQPLDLSKAIMAAQALAQKEDRLIFFGSEFLGLEGLFTAKGASKIQRSDWSVGDNAFTDVMSAIAIFQSKSLIGRYCLILSPDMYFKLHRLQPSLGMTEEERIKKMLNGHLYNSPVLGEQKAIMVCAEPQYMDLAIGKDIETGYLETKDFNHVFRIVETVALRIKCKDAIIIFE
ncbi:bacteriocin family protein [Tepidanaerobacter sp. GT38]|uniref:family 1 encapsulin nanocompartment shell protein n=1 Tax=Tepidanaerobacter sp. GT38 TaxID=2722793 RepID=UPI001F38EBF0|nr:family 1 encapsulin nanocompartment shell protein [Tepidanaerobacter sp. GT38]MCG1011305.1 bacteriocin family protein [Tepidanaerobacter sp. GT38]